MQLIRREGLPKLWMPGRMVQKAVGKQGSSISARMTMGFALFSEETDPMEPHCHAEETVYVISARDGWIRVGRESAQLGPEMYLEAGMVLHLSDGEWHVFEHAEGGHVDVVFFFGQVEDIGSGTFSER